MSSPIDQDALLSWKVLKLQQQSVPEPSLTIIGDSAFREGFIAQSGIQQCLRLKTASPVQVNVLTAGSLCLWDWLAIADCIKEHVRGIVVLEVSPLHMTTGITDLRQRIDHPRFAFESAALHDEEIRLGLKPPRDLGNYFLNEYPFFVARPQILWHLVSGPVKALPRFTGTRRWDEAQWDEHLDSLDRWMTEYRHSGWRAKEIYARLIRSIRAQPGITVVLMESIMNPEIRSLESDAGLESELREQYHRDIRAFARTMHVPYWDLNREVRLRPSEFKDYIHIRTNSAREELTNLLAAHAAAVLGTIDHRRTP